MISEFVGGAVASLLSIHHTLYFPSLDYAFPVLSVSGGALDLLIYPILTTRLVPELNVYEKPLDLDKGVTNTYCTMIFTLGLNAHAHA